MVVSEMACKDCTIDFNVNPSSHKRNKWGVAVAVTIGASAALISAISIPFVIPALRKICLPYVPATTLQVNNVLKVLRGKGGSLIDLGSGDGRIVIAAAQNGFKSTGVELNPWLVWFSKINSFRMGLSSNTYFIRKDIWKTDLKSYDNVVIFGVECMMEDLEKKCKSECPKHVSIVACRFPFPSLEPILVVGEGIDRVWLYSTNNR